MKVISKYPYHKGWTCTNKYQKTVAELWSKDFRWNKSKVCVREIDLKGCYTLMRSCSYVSKRAMTQVKTKKKLFVEDSNFFTFFCKSFRLMKIDRQGAYSNNWILPTFLSLSSLSRELVIRFSWNFGSRASRTLFYSTRVSVFFFFWKSKSIFCFFVTPN